MTMSNYRDFILQIASGVLNNRENLKEEDIPGIVCGLLRPHISRKISPKEIGNIVGKSLKQYGICIRCREFEVKNRNDDYCKFCKSALKEKVKNKLSKRLN